MTFKVEGAAPVPMSAAPLLALKVLITNRPAEMQIHSVMLRCQIQFEVTRRQYSAIEQQRLLDLFGEPGRWGETLRPLLWTQANTVVPAFNDSTVIELPVQCTFDFNVAATKYVAGLEDGEAPLILLFSGTIFYADDEGFLQVSQIPWDREARYRLPVRVWTAMMDAYYPNTAWLCLRRDVFERFYQYKVESGLQTFEQALERVLPAPRKQAGETSGGEETVH